MSSLLNILSSRFRILFANDTLRFGEKISLCSRFGTRANDQMKAVVLGRRDVDRIKIGGRSYWVPDGASPGFLDGMAQVLGEMYVFQDNFPLTELLSKGDVYLDLGANIGTTVMHAAEHVGVGGRVIAVEPIVVDVLKRNLSDNGFDDVIVIEKCASSEEGTIQMERSDFGIDSRMDGTPTAENAIEVPVTTIDAIVSEYKLEKLDLIKMDIEGAEESAIRGAQKQ